MGLLDNAGKGTVEAGVSQAHQALDEAIERVASDIEQPALDRIEAISKRWESIALQFHQDLETLNAAVEKLVGMISGGIRFGDPK